PLHPYPTNSGLEIEYIFRSFYSASSVLSRFVRSIAKAAFCTNSYSPPPHPFFFRHPPVLCSCPKSH
ncbi:hypothetical protein CEXT_200061, partial [Caerostris extrusa]